MLTYISQKFDELITVCNSYTRAQYIVMVLIQDEDTSSEFINLIDTTIYRDNICKYLKLNEINNLRKALRRKKLAYIYPVRDINDCITKIPWISSKMVRLVKLVSRNGTYSLLGRVCYESDHNLLHLMLKAGLDPNNTDRSVSLRIIDGIEGDENIKSINILLKFGMNPNLVFDSFGSALIYAANSGNLQIVKALLRAGSDINYINGSGCQALDYAIMNGHKAVVEELIQRRANIGSPYNFINLVAHGWADLVQYFLEKGSDVNLVYNDMGSNDSCTVLAEAVICENSSIINLLLKWGADPTYKNPRNKTILDIAHQTKNPLIIQIIEDAINARFS